MNFNKLYHLLVESKTDKLPILKIDSDLDKAPNNYTGIAIWPSGYKAWLLNGKYHREDGPAIENNGDTHWYLNGKRHRIGGPAVERADGYKAWYVNGIRHREDGPAKIREDGSKEWWLDDKPYSEQNYKIELIRRGINKDPSLSDMMDAI